ADKVDHTWFIIDHEDALTIARVLSWQFRRHYRTNSHSLRNGSGNSTSSPADGNTSTKVMRHQGMMSVVTPSSIQVTSFSVRSRGFLTMIAVSFGIGMSSTSSLTGSALLIWTSRVIIQPPVDRC